MGSGSSLKIRYLLKGIHDARAFIRNGHGFWNRGDLRFVGGPYFGRLICGPNQIDTHNPVPANESGADQF